MADKVIWRIEMYYDDGALRYLIPDEVTAGRIAIAKTKDNLFISGDKGKAECQVESGCQLEASCSRYRAVAFKDICVVGLGGFGLDRFRLGGLQRAVVDV